ncbi:MAG: hypothetical protein Q7S92_03825, partial [Candidatus Diapherotrites archaeon]|nr:hypothetical protein [Candidatus Diapherotrites archaeon]
MELNKTENVQTPAETTTSVEKVTESVVTETKTVVKPTKSFNVKLFDKWSSEGVQINDLSLVRYVLLDSKRIPITYGKYSKKAFQKSQMSIVERLINKIMRSGQGKRKLSGKYIRGRG